MQKQQPKRPFCWDEPTTKAAFALAALISLGMTLPQASRAEGDLNISRDGGNVNVNLNTATSPDVSIRRSDDIMVIKVPKSYKGNVNIDPALKKNSVVHEEETSSGKAITIQSQQIYLHTWDADNGGTPNATAHDDKTEKSDKKANDDESKDAIGPGGFLQLSPTDSKTKLERPSDHHNESNQGHSSGEKHRHHNSTNPPEPRPMDITRLLDQASLLGAPQYSQPEVRHDRPRHDLPTDDQPKKGKQGKGKAALKHSAEEVQSNPEASANPNLEESELEPLEADSIKQAAAIQASINGLLRIFFSLLLVLGMIYGFGKVLLPKLLDRYPDFFERLRESRQWSTEMPSQAMNQWNKPSPQQGQKLSARNQAPDSPKTNKKFNPITALAEQFLNATPISVREMRTEPEYRPESGKATVPARTEPSKKGYLERLKVAGEYFQVLQTTMLGKGKELHLVELKGKQFLVATTPYTVTLLKDLSEEGDAPAANASLPMSAPSPQPEIKQISQQRTMMPPSFPSQPVQPQAGRAVNQPNQPVARNEASAQLREVKSETIAYLSDETPITRVRQAKPYATPPGASAPGHRKPAVPQFPATVEDDYPTYLNMPSQRQPAASPRPQSNAGQPAYIDAEEVVVLEDYDDFYRR